MELALQVEKSAPFEANQSDDIYQFLIFRQGKKLVEKKELISNSLIMLKAAKLLKSSAGDLSKAKNLFLFTCIERSGSESIMIRH